MALLLLGIALIFLLTVPQAAIGQPPRTIAVDPAELGTGIWWKPVCDETSITVMLDQARIWGFSNVYVDIFSDGETWYAGEFFPVKPGVDSRDWLTFLIDEAHKRDLRVHGWAKLLSWQTSTRESTHPLLLKNPGWLDVTITGGRASAEQQVYYVSPAVPEVRSLVTSMTAELLERYDLDGLNLDGLQYSAVAEYGYHPISVAGFMREYGLDPKEIGPVSNFPFADNEDWMRWVTWREDQLTEVLEEVSGVVRSLERDHPILLSANYRPEYMRLRGRLKRLQNWKPWIERGLVDFTVPLVQGTQPSQIEGALREARSAHAAEDVACIPGLILRKPGAPSLLYEEQLQILHMTGFRYCNVMDYDALLEEVTISD